MSGAAMPPGFALQGEELARVQHVLTSNREVERDRRVRRVLAVGGGWIFGATMAMVAVASLGVMWNRPVPQDRIHVAILHDDGTYDAPMAREDLPASRRAMLFRYTVAQYVQARENYSWEGSAANYRRASAMSAPAERERYQAVMLDRRSPDNPEVLYGSGINAGIADVIDVRIKADPATPNAVDAVFLLKISAPNTSPRVIRKSARMVWASAESDIPATIQQQYDPLGIAFTHYSATIDPDTTR